MSERFVAVIREPTKIWTDYEVIDLERRVVVAKCSMDKDAEAIALALNRQTKPGGPDNDVQLLLSETIP